MKTYEDLRAEASRKWAATQAQHEARLEQMAQEFSNSPDVRLRPDPSVPWSYAGIVHVCEQGTPSEAFYVERWVTVNGLRHRWEGRCAGCQARLCWDWSLNTWLGNSPLTPKST
jgi:hypothetical protein